jgi:cell fate regulator YaaT (PSP1 superfamily)
MSENNDVIDAPKEPESPISQTIAGVRFRSCGKMYTFDADDIEVSPGSHVVVDSEMGLSLGRVVTPKQIIERTKEPLKKILRIATDDDFETAKKNKGLEGEARAYCIEKVKEFNLPMKIVASETTLDQKRLIFYFTADGRIDFRELVRELASKFKTRIEMRQIGVRDEVKLLGGFGCCGRQTCCSLFLTSFEPITIKMAKEQDLSINQSKLSGVCGRLMCCLGYEHGVPREPARSRRDRSEAAGAEDQVTDGVENIRPEEPRDSDLPQGDADRMSLRETQPEKDRTSRPDQEGAGDRKRSPRRHFKRKKRSKTNKDAQQQAPSSGPAPKPAESSSANSQGEQKPKSKTGRRRRKFWKKKKSGADGPQAGQ